MSEKPDALAEFLRAMQARAEEANRAIASYVEQWGPVIEAFARIAASPGVQAELRRGALKRISGHRFCCCLCVLVHPGDTGICEAFSPVTTVRRSSAPTVDVPACGPCAAADAARRLLA